MSALRQKNLAHGNAGFIRIFKSKKTLEVRVKQNDKLFLYLLFIYFFSELSDLHFLGQPGPKIRQRGGQSPEGFYQVGLGQQNSYICG